MRLPTWAWTAIGLMQMCVLYSQKYLLEIVASGLTAWSSTHGLKRILLLVGVRVATEEKENHHANPNKRDPAQRY